MAVRVINKINCIRFFNVSISSRKLIVSSIVSS
jgi:hypothetical protein